MVRNENAVFDIWCMEEDFGFLTSFQSVTQKSDFFVVDMPGPLKMGLFDGSCNCVQLLGM